MNRHSRSPRDRRLWTKDEDATLRREAESQAATDGSIVDWCAIATKLPNRTNKDCRKRWTKIAGGVSKGTWSEAEDDRLRYAVGTFGTRWTSVAQEVQTRNADQCSKRWLHFLDPRLDRGKWSAEDDNKLMLAVAEFGTDWRQICLTHFPHRSATNVKNRYNNIKQRVGSEHSTARSVASSASPSFRDSPSLEAPSPSTGSPPTSVAGAPHGWSQGDFPNPGFRSVSGTPGSVHPDHAASSMGAHFVDWHPVESYFGSHAPFSSVDPSRSHTYSHDQTVPTSDPDLEWNRFFAQNSQSHPHALGFQSSNDARGLASIHHEGMQGQLPQYTLPSNVRPPQRQTSPGEGSSSAHASQAADSPWVMRPSRVSQRGEDEPRAGPSEQLYSLVVDGVSPQTVQNLVSFLSNSELSYTLRLASQNSAPGDGGAAVEPGAPSAQMDPRSWDQTLTGAAPGVRHTVRIEDLSLQTMQHLLNVLDKSNLRVHARVST